MPVASQRGSAGTGPGRLGAQSPVSAPEAPQHPAVLIVDDEDLVRMVIADALRDAGFTVVEACSADEALGLLANRAGGVRAMISDIRMPGAMDGLALARAVRQNDPAIKVFLTSGHVRDLDCVEHDGVFQKPYDPEEIIRHLRQLLD